MKELCIGVLLLLLASGVKAQNTAQISEEKISQKILGNWYGTGTLMGGPAKFQMEWKTTLNNKFLQLTFSNTFKDRQGTERQMQSKAYYNFTTKKGVWVDSRGVILPLTLEINNNSLTVLWGDATTERGKTVYTLQDNKVSVEDYVFRNDTYFLFGKAGYAQK